MDRRVATVWLLAGSLLCAPLGSVLEAGTTGKIAGRVTDAATHDPLPGVNVVIEGTMMGAATDANGYYFIINVPPGIHTVKASMIGYQQMRYENVRVSIDMTTTLHFRLAETVLELGEAVTVVAERPLVRKDLTSTEAVVNSQTIQRLPVDRFHDVVNLQAGVIEGHFRGGRRGEVMYMIDGIPVNDIYSGQPAFEVENNAIAELQVISGTFNAEHGQAMSGVVNIVTREGGDRYAGSLSAYLGDYLSWGKKQKEIFWNIDRLNPAYNLQGTLSGPVPYTAGAVNFFLSGRYYDSEGYIYGKDTCVPSDHSDFTADSEGKWTIMSHGKTYPFSEETARRLIADAEPVPMNPERRATAQGKLSVRLSKADKLSVETLLQDSYFRYYDHRFRLNPSGDYKRYQRGYNTSLAWNRVLSPRAFFSLKGTYFYTAYEQFALEDPFDPGYVPSRRLQDTGANAFLTGGMQMWHFQRSTGTIVGKFDLTFQATQTHQLKTGLEVKQHRLWMHEFEVVPELPERIPPRTSFNNNQYTHRPMEVAFYVQDKMEFDYMIVNAGVRFDHFAPDGQVPTDFREPSSSPLVSAEGSSQLSPRLGIAYPITERGVIHVSYGHFFQIPNLDFMYTNPEFDIYPLQSTPSPPPHSLLNTIGNTTLKPQKTVIYEIGLQQQLTEDLALDVTAYSKDIRNLLGTEVLMTLQGIRYGRYINRDYGNVKGVTVAFEKRHKVGVGATVDYTFQIAKGNASDPNTAFLDQQTDPPRETTKQMVPLNWDRRHQLNATLTLGSGDDASLNVIGRLGTGLPYTPSFQNIQTAVENSGRKPLQYNIDLYAYRTIRLGKMAVQFFVRVYNLFDRLNEVEVFTDTGRAGYSLAPVYSGGLRPRGINTLEQYYVRPDFYSAPRQVQCGLTLEF